MIVYAHEYVCKAQTALLTIAPLLDLLLDAPLHRTLHLVLPRDVCAREALEHGPSNGRFTNFLTQNVSSEPFPEPNLL